MAEFDATKDKKLAEKEIQFEGKTELLVVGVYKYGEGEPKIQIARSYFDRNNEKKFAKAGRLTWNEFVEVAKAVKEIFPK